MLSTLTYKNIFVIVIVITMLAALLIEHVVILTGATVALLLWSIMNKDLKIAILITLLLTIISDISETIRLIVNVLVIILACYYFIEKYGISLSNFPKLPKYFLSYILLVIFSLIIATIFSTNISIGLIFILKQIIFFALVYIFFTLIENDKHVKYYLYALIFPAVVISFSIIVAFLKSDKLIYMFQTLGFTISSAYIDNVAFAGGLFTITMGLTVYLLIINKNSKNYIKTILYIFLLIQIIALILTNSRAAILGGFISIAFLILSYFKKRRKLIVIGALVTIFILVISNPQIVESFLLFIRAERIFENPRYNLWEISFNIIRDNLFFGVGPGNFAAYIYKYNPAMLGSFESIDIKFVHDFATIGHSHNFFLFLFSELGLLGLICAILLPYFYFLYTFRLKKIIVESDFESYWLIITLIGIGLGMFTRSLFESTGLLSYGWITRDLPFWILFSIVIFYYQKYYSFKSNL